MFTWLESINFSAPVAFGHKKQYTEHWCGTDTDQFASSPQAGVTNTYSKSPADVKSIKSTHTLQSCLAKIKLTKKWALVLCLQISRDTDLLAPVFQHLSEGPGKQTQEYYHSCIKYNTGLTTLIHVIPVSQKTVMSVYCLACMRSRHLRSAQHSPRNSPPPPPPQYKAYWPVPKCNVYSLDGICTRHLLLIHLGAGNSHCKQSLSPPPPPPPPTPSNIYCKA